MDNKDQKIVNVVPDYIKRARKKYSETHKVKLAAYHANWYEANKERLSEERKAARKLITDEKKRVIAEQKLNGTFIEPPPRKKRMQNNDSGITDSMVLELRKCMIIGNAIANKRDFTDDEKNKLIELNEIMRLSSLS